MKYLATLVVEVTGTSKLPVHIIHPTLEVTIENTNKIVQLQRPKPVEMSPVRTLRRLSQRQKLQQKVVVDGEAFPVVDPQAPAAGVAKYAKNP